MTRPIRLTAVLTHPTQYSAPWFRHIAAHCSGLELTVLYATRPTPAQQGVTFGTAFSWDVPLTEGYRCCLVRAARAEDSVHSGSFWGLNVPEISAAIRESRPDVVLIPGWHSVTLLRALLSCRRAGIPVLYRGDTHMGTGPTGWLRPVWSLRTRLLLRLFDGYLSVGRLADIYLKHFGARETCIFLAPHCVDNEFFAAAASPHQSAAGRIAARGSLGFRAEDFLVLFVGKLEPGKRLLDLIRAIARLGPGAGLLVVGAGGLEAPCRREAERLGVRVEWAGFLNQSTLGRAYAAADCLALPSEGESWGLVVNEALATGLPCVVSDRVGCAPDLVISQETGEVFPMGDVTALALCLERVRERQRRGHDWGPACRGRVADYSFESATTGLLKACRALVDGQHLPAVPRANRGSPRVVACCGGMVIVSGRERMTFEVLRALRGRGAAIHCIVNTWDSHRIVALAEQAGATWSTGFYWYLFDRHARNPIRWAQLAWDIVRTSSGLLRDAGRLRATHVLVPEHETTLRNAPALLLLRLIGVPVIFRVGNTPDTGVFYRRLWSRVLPALVTRFVANSHFTAARLGAVGVPTRKIVTIRNTLPSRVVSSVTDDAVISLVRSRRTILCVGQIAPFKGTHLVVDAALALIRGGEDVQAVIVGRLPTWPPDFVQYLQDAHSRVLAENAEDRVHFVGERENVLEIMRVAYVLAAPIIGEEAFGLVALEAKSAGLPVVAFPSGGLPESVEHGVTGFLCPDATLGGLLEGLRYFLGDPRRRDEASAASFASLAHPESDLSRVVFEEKWWSLFRELRS